ncbi:MAG: phosphoribosylformylglycinamidine cyclo-ligase [Myxococcota bacterium]
MADAYRSAGVDIEAGDRLVDRIKPLAKSTHRPGVLGGIGGFGGMFAIPPGYTEPILVSGTDGVGTKLLLAQALGKHDTIGIDLVAMCVNDIAVLGAEPLFFLDYFATGRLDVDAAAEVVAGIAEGCRQAGCALLGGETAEMPGMYAPGHYDLAGFAVGCVEKSRLPDPEAVAVGDVLLALPSNGLHSNGYSLVRKVIEGLDLAEHHGLGRPLGDVVLDPTRIYVRELVPLFRDGLLKGAAHITGGGLPGNVPRMLPDALGARIRRDAWEIPPLFRLLEQRGGLDLDDLLETFNCGIGMVLCVDPAHVAEVRARCDAFVLGEVTATPGLEVV